MAIEIAKTAKQLEVEYNQVFMVHLLVEQVPTANPDGLPKYRIQIEYRLYGVKDGVRYFQPEVRQLEVEDFLAEAYKQMLTGNDALVKAAPAIEAAIAALVAVDLGTETKVV